MNPDHLSDDRIIESWRKNAAPWTTAVRDGQIESRRLCTDRAIVDAIDSCSPRSLIDVGCGEGWLCRAFSERGCRVLGVDLVPELVAAAQQAGGGEFRVMPYDEIIAGAIQARADVVVCNFSLFGKEIVDGLVAAVPSLLADGGSFIVQTLHPPTAVGDGPYEDGWREGSWDGFDPAFTDPAPWYFRTIGGWVRLLTASGLRLRELREPRRPDSGAPASMILIAEPHHH